MRLGGLAGGARPILGARGGLARSGDYILAPSHTRNPAQRSTEASARAGWPRLPIPWRRAHRLENRPGTFLRVGGVPAGVDLARGLRDRGQPGGAGGTVGGALVPLARGGVRAAVQCAVRAALAGGRDGVLRTGAWGLPVRAAPGAARGLRGGPRISARRACVSDGGGTPFRGAVAPGMAGRSRAESALRKWGLCPRRVPRLPRSCICQDEGDPLPGQSSGRSGVSKLRVRPVASVIVTVASGLTMLSPKTSCRIKRIGLVPGSISTV